MKGKKLLNIAYLQSEVQKMNIPIQDAYFHVYREFLGLQLIYMHVCVCVYLQNIAKY